MPALPTTTTAFGSSATEAEFKTFITGMRDYLSGLLGEDGTIATAKETLDISFPTGIQVFKVSGTFTVPAGVTTVYVTGVGGGGNGGSGAASSFAASGGGSGDQCYRTPVTVTPGQTKAVTIAAAGGTTSFASDISLAGGANGTTGSSGANYKGGAGGGANGSDGSPANGVGSGSGGAGLFGRGAGSGGGTGTTTAGSAGKANTGAGGGGGAQPSGAGGAGATGILIVEW